MLNPMGEEILFVEVKCGRQNHTLHYNTEKGILLNDHGRGADVVISLGGQRSKCHELREKIIKVSRTNNMTEENVFTWYALGFDDIHMLSWGKYASPQEANRWRELGVTRAHILRNLHELGITSPEVYSEWKKVSIYPSNTSNIHVIAEYVKNGVNDPAEAEMWKKAGLVTPNLLPRYLKRGWSPKNLAKKNNIALSVEVKNG